MRRGPVRVGPHSEMRADSVMEAQTRIVAFSQLPGYIFGIAGAATRVSLLAAADCDSVTIRAH
ncbi:protein of unknown function [Paraburkholderia kururiensis]